MSRNSALGLALTAGLLALAPGGLMAQNVTNPDNTPFGTTAAEFLLFGAGARGTALGDAFATIATDVSALYYNPGGAALLRVRARASVPTITSPTLAIAGAGSPSRSPAALAPSAFSSGPSASTTSR